VQLATPADAPPATRAVAMLLRELGRARARRAEG
jgi:hypothetical protein